MENEEILLEFFDSDNYNFYLNFKFIKQDILRNIIFANDDGIIKEIKDSSFTLIDMGEGRYIFHNPNLHLCFFISINSCNLINYFLKFLSKNDRKIFIRSIYLLSNALHFMYSKKTIQPVEDIIIKERNRLKSLEISVENDYFDTFESNRINKSKANIFQNRDCYYTGHISNKNRVNIKTNIKLDHEIINLFYCVYCSHYLLSDLNREMVNSIFCEMDYYYALAYKTFKISKFKNNISFKEIPKEIAREIINENQKFTDSLEKSCLKLRSELIESVLKKYQQNNV